MATAYEGASSTRRFKKWQPSHSGPNLLLSGNLELLRSRSRELIRNNALANSLITKLVTNIVGTGITPLPQLQTTRHVLQNKFSEWSAQADIDGVTDFYGLQAQIVRAMLESGECFVLLKPVSKKTDIPVPLQLQVLEADYVPIQHHTIPKNPNNIIINGIEFNKLGKRVAYWMYQSHPGELDHRNTSVITKRIPASSVLHVYLPLRPGQVRGQPWLTPIISLLKNLDEFNDAALFRQAVANLYAGFIRQPAQEDNNEYDPVTGEIIQKDPNDIPTISLEPGTLQVLQPGEEIEFTSPPGAGSDYKDFMRQQVLLACSGVGVPYEIAIGDMSFVNDRTARVIFTEFRRFIQQTRSSTITSQFCKPFWKRWVNIAVLTERLELPNYFENPLPYLKMKWVGQGWEYINPVQEVAAQTKAIRSGLKSRSDALAEQGKEAEDVDIEIAEDNTRADELGLQYDSDSRTAKKEE